MRTKSTMNYPKDWQSLYLQLDYSVRKKYPTITKYVIATVEERFELDLPFEVRFKARKGPKGVNKNAKN